MLQKHHHLVLFEYDKYPLLSNPSLIQQHINENFARLSEALYIADRQASIVVCSNNKDDS